jgi:hypothetical protein
MKRNEYHEGPEALERFGHTMTALFRVPKGTVEKESVKPVRKPKTTGRLDAEKKAKEER